MSSDEVMALATDALRGQLLSVLPEDAGFALGAFGLAAGSGVVGLGGLWNAAADWNFL